MQGGGTGVEATVDFNGYNNIIALPKRACFCNSAMLGEFVTEKLVPQVFVSIEGPGLHSSIDCTDLLFFAETVVLTRSV